jgi:fucose 4-O-acetylase-like acetyltransferase
MDGYEEILGGFWFLRSLFVSCFLIAVVSFIIRYDFRYKYWFLCVLFLVATIVIRKIVPNIEFWREISMGCLGATFYMLGYLLMPFSRYWQNRYCCLAFFSSLLFFFYYFKAGISMGCGYNKVLPFTLSAISGTLFIIYLSKQLEENTSLAKRVLYYIGNHTLDILALHFLSFRFISYLFTIVYSLDVVLVAEHPVIKDISQSPNYWWIIYSFAGILVPLLMNRVWQMIVNKIQKGNG